MNSQAFVVWSSAFTAFAGVALITIYSSYAPWWRSLVGRMLMVYAVSLTVLSALVSVALALHVDLIWIRISRSILILVVGLMMLLQSYLIIREQRRRRRP